MKRMKNVLVILIDILLAALLVFLGIRERDNVRFNEYLRLVGTERSRTVSEERQTFYLEELHKEIENHHDLANSFGDILGGYALVRVEEQKWELPFDVNYYVRPGDREPALVLEKGTTLILGNEYRGHGFYSFPTENKAWRAVHPFVTGKDTQLQGPYYIKWDDLCRLFDACDVGLYKNPIMLERRLGHTVSEETMKRATLCSVDIALLRGGLYHSRNMFTVSLPAWLLAVAAALLVEINIWLICRKFILRKRIIAHKKPAVWLAGIFAAADILLGILVLMNLRHAAYNEKVKAAAPYHTPVTTNSNKPDYMTEITEAQVLLYLLGSRTSSDPQPGLNQMELPDDLHYYASPDDKVPVLTLPKGTMVYLSNQFAFQPNIGYGLLSFPTDRAGWRLAHPFWTEDNRSLQGPYYVKLHELMKVASERYDIDREAIPCEERWGSKTLTFRQFLESYAEGSKLSEHDAMRFWMTRADVMLMRSDRFGSPDLFKKALPLWASALAVLLFVELNVIAIACVASIEPIRKRSGRHSRKKT